MSELMRETEDVASRRKAYKEMKELLRRAVEIVNEVRDFNTFKWRRQEIDKDNNSVEVEVWFPLEATCSTSALLLVTRSSSTFPVHSTN